MRRFLRYSIGTLASSVIVAAAVFAIEIYHAINARPPLPYKNPDHSPVNLGLSGPKLTYLVIGDSTGAGVGAEYVDGIAMGTAEYLARSHRVTLVNLAISGSVAADVVRDQLKNGETVHPDIVLLAVGANDATHFTGGAVLKTQLEAIVRGLRSANPAVKIIVTGCPQMGSVPRFQQPLRWFAGLQTARVNRIFTQITQAHDLIWAHIADRTGSAFAGDPTLFAADEFHPNARGYALWTSVLNEALDKALNSSQQ